MTKNIGRFDQILRIGISMGLIYAIFTNEHLIDDSFSSSIIFTIAILNLIIALIRFCPLYALTGICTAHPEAK